MEEIYYRAPFEQVVEALNRVSAGEHGQLVTGLDGSARSVMLAQMYQAKPRQLLIVEPIPTHLMQLYDDLTQLLSAEEVLLFPAEEALAMEFSFASLDHAAQRVAALDRLASGEPCVILTSVPGIRKQLTLPQVWRQEVLTLELGMELARPDLERKLNDFGYLRQAMVQAPGEYSIRGSIVDFYPLNTEYPVRLDFFDTELDSIRYFNGDSQESIRNIEEIRLLPAKEIVFPLASQQALAPRLQADLDAALGKMTDSILREAVASGMGEQLTALIEGEPLKHAAAYLGLAQQKSVTLIDYVAPTGAIILMEYDKIQQQELRLMEEDQFWIEQEVMKGSLLPKLAIHAPVREAIKQAKVQRIYCSVIQKGFGNLTFEAVHPFQYRSMNQFFNQLPLVKSEVDHWLRQGTVIQVVVATAKQAQRTADLFEEAGIVPVVLQERQPQTQAVNIVVGQLNSGFELPLAKWVVLTERELFNRVKKRQVKQQTLSNAERIKSYNELNVGDYVVHINHGIGKYTGLDTIEISGVHRDFLAVEYQNSSRILIPVDQIHLLQKYVSSESKTPKLNKLGGSEWAKTKQKVAAKIEDIADELIALYAKREREVGYAFDKDTPEQAEFESAFSYVETDDQLRSAAEIKADMEKRKPMDRLLVGDVGYGKTEVAMRAIFKAVMEGKQVAFLVPTTILAQQHYNTLVQRFAEYPVEIGLLSRFVTKAKQKVTIEGLATGAVNIVIGTHRLLSKDVAFEDLGLLIVDEEQRFGVKHKERLKQLKSQVDVLTLTATPIPRTLHMSMIGVRDLSVIETPPNNRFPVQTYVMERNEGAIKSGIEREMARGGQIFYLYNRVATIEQRALEIRDLVPEARVAVAHGQMTEVELETVLVDFIEGAYDVLVTTTIIETGVDIPNANTLFVEDADHMGLSTLYQLRGRVGRTNRVAYAYLMYEPFKQLSEVGEKRLAAIREFTELGSGFKIAMRDLSIRGAGNLLGKQQSGFIDSVGFDLYSQMLKEAVDIKRGNTRAVRPEDRVQIEWDIAIDAYIPKAYMPDERQKIAAYKAIQQIDSEDSYRAVQDQLIDRYGEFPDEVADLLEVALIKHYGLQVGVTHIKQTSGELRVTFSEGASTQLQGVTIFEALQDVPLKAHIQLTDGKMTVTLAIKSLHSDQWLAQLKHFIREVQQVLERKGELNEVG
ncbi:MAG: transcription-repair coupling factor [Aerococcaceae bacterium]|nr:transcription-repair coupling factor [Aerococcaceae bacterium]